MADDQHPAIEHDPRANTTAAQNVLIPNDPASHIEPAPAEPAADPVA